MEVVTARQSLSRFQFKLGVVPPQPQAPEYHPHLSLFWATSLEIHQVARWCRASPENTLSDLPIINDPKDLVLKDDGMALCLYDDTMKVWSTTRDWALQWVEVGRRIADAIEKNPTIQSPLDENMNYLDVGHGGFHNFEGEFVEENRTVPSYLSPFMLTNLDEEEVMKRMEAEFINLPYNSDEEELQVPYSPLSDISDAVSTPPLSPDSIGSPCGLPGFSFELESPFSSTSPLSLSGCRTVSPYEIFSPLPQVEDWNDIAMRPEAPPTPVVSTKPLPEPDTTSPYSPDPLPFRSPSPPVASPSRSSALKRPRRFKDESGDESDDFVPEKRKPARLGKRTKASSLKRAKLENRGAKCDLCGNTLGRATDLPRHKASCKANPERAIRTIPCEICRKPLPVRADAVKRHRASKTCRSKLQNGDNEDPHVSEP